MSATINAEELVFILKLCDKMLVSESDINKLIIILGNPSLHNLYKFVSSLPLNTTKIKEVILKMRANASEQQKKIANSEGKKLSLLKVSDEQQRRRNQYQKLLNSKVPVRRS